VIKLTNVDEDLSAMYITARAKGRPRSIHDHVQLELLLESFVKQVEEIVSEVDTTVVSLRFRQMTEAHLAGKHAIHPGNCRTHARFWS
jgi:magnesium transporter